MFAWKCHTISHCNNNNNTNHPKLNWTHVTQQQSLHADNKLNISTSTCSLWWTSDLLLLWTEIYIINIVPAFITPSWYIRCFRCAIINILKSRITFPFYGKSSFYLFALCIILFNSSYFRIPLFVLTILKQYLFQFQSSYISLWIEHDIYSIYY